MRHGKFTFYLLQYQGAYDQILPWPVQFQCMLEVLPPTLSGMPGIVDAVSITQLAATSTSCPTIYQFGDILDLQRLRQYCVGDMLYFKATVGILKRSAINQA